MQNQVFNFEPDTPAIISLKYRTGKEFNRNGRRGFTYTLTNGLVTFFPPDVDREIQALHLDAGQPIKITKTKAGAWEIERVAGGSGESFGGDASRPMGYNSAPTSETVTDGARQHCSNHNTNGSAPPLTTRESQAFYRQLVASIEAVKSAELHAVQIGHPVTFSSEDIRALAISGFIQQAREGY